ncbi:MAG: winged helix-turn-helix transcriptional regulator [Deltaproteobacteria bacterium]|nr:winged helix-turn-helix transcriptional regulator [Deltaproteobacteria bacterium]
MMANFVRAFRALGDATRQKMLALLERKGELCVSELAQNFDMTQPSISHHLRILKDAGLVTAHKRGKEVYYAINPDELTKCCGLFFADFACCRPMLKNVRRRSRALAEGES